MNLKPLSQLLDETASLHHHLCPRQVLGVRMGLLAGEVLGLDLPQADKRLLAIVETDGCGADGIAVATNCRVGRRTMRIEDYGKMASTFVDTCTGQSIRIKPTLTARVQSVVYAPEARDSWEAQLWGYQRMPTGELLAVQAVRLNASLEAILSQPGLRAICQVCGEEIINEREVVVEGQILCRACAGQAYYTLLETLRGEGGG